MKTKTVVSFLMIAFIIITMVGCVSTKATMENQACEGWTEKTGEKVDDVTSFLYSKGMSESHRMMAAMILSANGMETDLEKYDDVYLVKMETNTGEERVMVVADGKNVFPANVK